MSTSSAPSAWLLSRWSATRSAPPPFSQLSNNRMRRRGPSAAGGGSSGAIGWLLAALRHLWQSRRRGRPDLVLAAYQLLVGSAAFWARAASDIEAARKRVLVQAMTFEGDAAGQKVAAAVRGSGAADRRILVDDYTRVVVSDRFVKTP